MHLKRGEYIFSIRYIYQNVYAVVTEKNRIKKLVKKIKITKCYIK
jgi:hypothetical protein